MSVSKSAKYPIFNLKWNLKKHYKNSVHHENETVKTLLILYVFLPKVLRPYYFMTDLFES